MKKKTPSNFCSLHEQILLHKYCAANAGAGG